MSSPTSTCRCSRRSATSPRRRSPTLPRSSAHSKAIGEHYDLYGNACFQTEVTRAALGRGRCPLDRLDEPRRPHAGPLRLHANGPLHRPKLPGIPGIEAFQGHTFHTSRWDYDYTGGDSDGNLTGLHGKRIGITGTGATAVQRMPDLGESAEHPYVFQRTPSSVDVRNNRPTDPEWAASLGPGWQKRRIDNFDTLVSGGYKAEDMVNDGWTNIIDKLLITVRKAEGAADLSAEGLARTAELADFEKMEQIRGRVETIVNDPSTAEALKPYYRQLCKRLCFHDEYLDTSNRPNVTLVDTQGKGVERITERGIVANGVEYEIDCLIYATGSARSRHRKRPKARGSRGSSSSP